MFTDENDDSLGSLLQKNGLTRSTAWTRIGYLSLGTRGQMLLSEDIVPRNSTSQLVTFKSPISHKKQPFSWKCCSMQSSPNVVLNIRILWNKLSNGRHFFFYHLELTITGWWSLCYEITYLKRTRAFYILITSGIVGCLQKNHGKSFHLSQNFIHLYNGFVQDVSSVANLNRTTVTILSKSVVCKDKEKKLIKFR